MSETTADALDGSMPRDAARDLKFTIFTVLWATAALFHLANQAPWIDKPWTLVPLKFSLEMAMIVAALAVYAKPGDLTRFVVLVGLEALHAGSEFPRVANHWMMTFFIDLVMLSAAAQTYLKGSWTGRDWLRALGPGARWVYLIGYSYAALAKLNTDFLNPDVSCASTTWTEIMAYFGLPFLDGWFFHQVSIWTTIVVEIALPLSLLSRRTVLPGIMMGLVFHYLISFTPVLRVPDFASFLMACWFLFVPVEVVPTLARKAAGLKDTLADLFPVITPARLAAVVGAYTALGFVLAAVGVGSSLAWFNQLRMNFYTFYGMAGMVIFFLGWRGQATVPSDRPSLRVVDPMAMVVVAIMLVTGLFPYIGFRTHTNLSMFSNLQTEDHRPNHVLMPQLYLWDYQNDLVEILDTDNERLKLLTADDQLLPWWEVVYTVSHTPEAHITYRRDGVRVEVPRVGDHPELGTIPPAYQRWTMSFRPVTQELYNQCKW